MGWYTDFKSGIYHGTGNIVDGLTGKTQADSSRDAANIQANAGQKALDAQRGIYDQGVRNFDPYLQGGQQDYSNFRNQVSGGRFDAPTFNPGASQQFQGNQTYKDPGFSISDLAQDPGYQFRLKQGLQSVEGSAAARGMLHSGNTLRGLNDYAQGFASNEVANAFDRYSNRRDFGQKQAYDNNSQNFDQFKSGRDFNYGQNLDVYNSGVNSRQNSFNNLSQLAGYGQQAASNLAGLGQNYANSQTSTLEGIGNSQAAGRVGVGNAFQQPIQNGFNLAGAYFGGKK